MKLTNITASKTFTKDNFPAGTFFKFGKELYIVLGWGAKEASVFELDTETAFEFVESKFPDYQEVDVKEIIYSIA
jgi:hypothetical protein